MGKRWTTSDPLEGDPDEAALKDPFQRALIRNLRLLNRHLWELRSSVALASDYFQAVEERERRAREKG